MRDSQVLVVSENINPEKSKKLVKAKPLKMKGC